MRKYVCSLLALVMFHTAGLAASAGGSASSSVNLSLPPGNVTFYADGGIDSFFVIGLSGINDIYDVQSDLYPGWCIDYYAANSPTGNNYPGRLYNSYAASGSTFANLPWDMINYVINHQQGMRDEVQAAIWFFSNGVTFDITPAAQAMIDDALAHGSGFVPSVGQGVAVILQPGVPVQGIIIVVPRPPHSGGNGSGGNGGNCTNDFVTGGGWIIGPSGAKANFGVHGGIRKGQLWGGLNYLDHGTKMHVKSTAVTDYQRVDANTRMISYDVTIDGEAGTAVVRVTDNGEPGTRDMFAIALSNGYSAGGQLGGTVKRGGGGNIQLHKPKCKKDK